MDPGFAVRGFILGFTIAAGVGPISLLVIRRTLAEGWPRGLASGLGVATADAIYGAIAAFGLGAVAQVLVGARRPLGLVGGVVLLWLAWRTLRSEPAEVAPDRGATGGQGGAVGLVGLVGAYLSILGLTLANPMTILSFAALFAGLGVASGEAGDAGLIVLGVLIGSATWWVILTFVVSRLRRRASPVWTRRINVGSGVAIAAFAVVALAAAAGVGLGP